MKRMIIAAIAAAAVLAGSLGLVGVVGVSPASAAYASNGEPVWIPRNATNTADLLRADNRALAKIGNVLYVGGDFTELAPELGAPAVQQANLAAFNATTGVPIASFAPQLDGKVYAMVASADGTALYVGGSFTGGFAILDPTTGQPKGPQVTSDGEVHALYLDGASTLYVGGQFQKFGGVNNRKMMAKLGHHGPDGRPGLRTPVRRRDGRRHRHLSRPQPALRRRSVHDAQQRGGGQGRRPQPDERRPRLVVQPAAEHDQAAGRGRRGPRHEGLRGLRRRLQPVRPVQRRHRRAGVRLLRRWGRAGGPPRQRRGRRHRPARRRALRRQPQEELHARHDPDGPHRRVPGRRHGRFAAGGRQPHAVLERLRQRARGVGVPGHEPHRHLGRRRLPQGLVPQHRRPGPLPRRVDVHGWPEPVDPDQRAGHRADAGRLHGVVERVDRQQGRGRLLRRRRRRPPCDLARHDGRRQRAEPGRHDDRPGAGLRREGQPLGTVGRRAGDHAHRRCAALGAHQPAGPQRQHLGAGPRLERRRRQRHRHRVPGVRRRCAARHHVGAVAGAQQPHAGQPAHLPGHGQGRRRQRLATERDAHRAGLLGGAEGRPDDDLEVPRPRRPAGLHLARCRLRRLGLGLGEGAARLRQGGHHRQRHHHRLGAQQQQPLPDLLRPHHLHPGRSDRHHRHGAEAARDRWRRGLRERAPGLQRQPPGRPRARPRRARRRGTPRRSTSPASSGCP